MTSDGWEPDALTAHVRIYEGANSIVHGSNIVTPPGKPVANRENKPYPKCKRVRPTHRGAADSACFEWNDHSGGPVILDVELSRFAGFGSLLFDQSTFDSARVGVSNLVALTLSREGSGAWVGAIASKPTTPATVDPSARRGLVWSRTPTTQVIP